MSSWNRNGSIFYDARDLRLHLDLMLESHGRAPTSLVTTSGGFDPLHVGHLQCIQEAARLGDTLVVIVNGDGFLERKKGAAFMPLEERMEIISSIRGVDYVVPWDDGSQFVTGCLDLLRPSIFAKGGDRSDPDKVPEFKLCKEIGCEVVFNVGGGKIQSSSLLISKSNSSKLLQETSSEN